MITVIIYYLYKILLTKYFIHNTNSGIIGNSNLKCGGKEKVSFRNAIEVISFKEGIIILKYFM